MTANRTLCILKPDLVANCAGTALVLRMLTRDLDMAKVRVLDPMGLVDAQSLYAEHRGAAHYGRNITFMTSGPSVAILLQGNEAVGMLRDLIGPTDPKKAHPTTIRGMFGTELPRNAIHASANATAAEREIAIFFGGGAA